MALLPRPGTATTTGRSTPRLNTSLTDDQRRKLLAQLAAVRLGQPVRKESGGGIPFVPDIVEDAVGQISSALINTPGGLWHMGSEVARDFGDLAQRGDLTPERTVGLGAEIGKSIYQDFRHPRENIGYLLMDLFGGASLALRTAGRAGRVTQNLRSLRSEPGGEGPSPLLPPGTPVPRGPIAPPPALPPSPGEVARETAEVVRATQRDPIVTERPATPRTTMQPGQQYRIPGFELPYYSAPPRAVPDEVEPPIQQRSLFSDPGPPERFPPVGAQMQLPTLLESDPRPVSPQSLLPSLPRPTPAVRPDGTPMNLPPTIADLARQTEGKEGPKPRVLPDLDEFGEPIKAKHTPASSIVRIYADRKTKRLEIDETDTQLNARPVREAGKTRFQLFDGDQPLVPVVAGFKNAKDALGEAYLARKGGIEDSPLLQKAADVEAPDPMAALMAAIDEKAAKKPKPAKPVGKGRFKAQLVPEIGWAVVDTTKAGSQHKVYRFADPEQQAKNVERRASFEKEITKLEAAGTGLTPKGAKRKRTKTQEERYQQMLAIREEATKEVGEDVAQTQAAKHAERLNKAAALREMGLPINSMRYEKYADEDLYRQQRGMDDDEPIPSMKERLAEGQAAFSRENAEKPAVKPVAAKPEKPTPRELGADSRTQQLNPRALGVSQRQLEEYGLTKTQAQEITRRLAPELRTLWKDALAAGKEKPTRRSVHEALVKHVGEDLAKKITARMMRAKGGAPITMREVVRAVRTALPDPRRTAPLTRTVETTVEVASKVIGAGKMKPKPGSGRGGTLVKRPMKETVQIPLSRNPLVAGAQKVLIKSYEKHPDFRIPGLRRDLDRRFEFEQREIARIADMLEAEHVTEDRFKVAARKALESPIKDKASVGDFVDSFNQASKIGLLFLKPAYVPANLLGQMAITIADHSFNPVNLAKSWKLSAQMVKGKNQPELQRIKRKMDDVMQQGFVDAVAYEKGAVRPLGVVYERAASKFSAVLDTPFRRATFFHEARRSGHDTPAKVEALLNAKKGTKEYDELIDIARRANRNIIDYGRMGPREKKIIRRIVFFYPWMKGATIYGAHFLSEHSTAGTIAVQSGKQADERAARELGPLPSYLEGVFKVGEKDVPGLGKVPSVINPKSASVLGTPGEALSFARSLIGGGTLEADQPSSILTPAFSSAIAAFTRQDPFTGRDYPASKSTLGIVFEELKKTVAPVRLKENLDKARSIEKGEIDASEVLFPGGQGEALGRFVGGTTPVSLNTREAQSRAFAEQRTLQSKRQREISKHGGYRSLYLERARSVGLVPPGQDLPDVVKKAFTARAQRYANRAALEQDLGHDMRAVDRLRSDLDLLVRQKKMNEQTAQSILISLGGMDENTISSFLRDLGDQFFMAETLSAYRAALNERGAEITVP